MVEGERVGLQRVEAILERDELTGYFPAHATRAELLTKLGENGAAREAWQRALALMELEPEQRLVRRCLDSLQS